MMRGFLLNLKSEALFGDTTAWNGSTGGGYHCPPLAQVHNKVVQQRLQLKWHAA